MRPRVGQPAAAALWLRAVLVPPLVAGSMACASDASLPDDDTPMAALERVTEIGGLEGGADQQFSGVRGAVVGSDGTLWVADGGAALGTSGSSARLRRFGPGGEYLGQAGRDGSGPGEYSAPNGLAVLPDGRVALRDYNLPDRLTLFTAQGVLDTVLVLPTRYTYGHSAVEPLRADGDGHLWLRWSGRPGPERRMGLVRIATDGTVLDSLPFPEPPRLPLVRVDYTARFPSGNTSPRSLIPPHQAWGQWALSPRGEVATTRGDSYRVEIRPLDGADGAAPRVIERNVPPVPVSQEERRAILDGFRADLERGGAFGVGLPDIPSHKAPIRALRFADDGQLLVQVAAPSMATDEGWREREVWDVFDRQDTLRGRLALPTGCYLRGLRGDTLWSLCLGDFGVESVTVHRIRWPG